MLPTKTTTIVRAKTKTVSTNGVNGHGPWPQTAPVQACLRVPNVREAIEFYEQLGFHVVLSVPSADGTGAWASLNMGGSGFQLYGTNNPDGPNTTRDARPTIQNRGFGVLLQAKVTDVKEIHQLAKKAKLTITGELREDFTGSRVFTCIDPYGFEWQFSQTVKQLMPNEVVEAALRRDH